MVVDYHFIATCEAKKILVDMRLMGRNLFEIFIRKIMWGEREKGKVIKFVSKNRMVKGVSNLLLFQGWSILTIKKHSKCWIIYLSSLYVRYGQSWIIASVVVRTFVSLEQVWNPTCCLEVPLNTFESFIKNKVLNFSP